MGKRLSLGSLLIAFLVSLSSAYLFSTNKIEFETLIWVVIGVLGFLVIIAYQDIHKELDAQKIDLQKLDEKLKI